MKPASSGNAATHVTLGWDAPPLHEQLNLPREDLAQVQADADAIVRLRLRGYLGDGTLKRMHRRLLKWIGETLDVAASRRGGTAGGGKGRRR